MIGKITAALLFSVAGLVSADFSQDKETEVVQNKHPIVKLKTSLGDITLELNAEKAPISVENFLQYVNEGHYNHTIFHRVISGFMIQGGGLDKDMVSKPSRGGITNEADNGLKNTRGAIAMARTSDVNSASSQFFINTVDNPFLDFKAKNPREYGYAVFGKVIDGMDVVDKIRGVETGNKAGHQDVPVETVEIIEAKVEKE